ncbi:hypothetical protein, partial [Pseudomonas syringae group genomosp. 7]|uniref:hypothetical protein n=1 Tax=Pseudomonas syringae group genomosp. 7 TaxID=251699 RepID=UPI00376FDC63
MVDVVVGLGGRSAEFVGVLVRRVGEGCAVVVGHVRLIYGLVLVVAVVLSVGLLCLVAVVALVLL